MTKRPVDTTDKQSYECFGVCVCVCLSLILLFCDYLAYNQAAFYFFFALIQTKCRKSVPFVSVHNNNNNNRVTYPCVHNSVVFIFSFRLVSFCVVAVVSKVPVVLSSKSEYFNMFVHVCRKVYVCFCIQRKKNG